MYPVEGRPGIALAARGNITVTHHALRRDSRKALHEGACGIGQGAVLARVERPIVAALQLDAYREIVAGMATCELRDAGVPGTVGERNVLHEAPVTMHQKMGGDPQTCQPSKIRMGI